MKDKYKFMREQDNQSLLFTWQHISAQQQYSHSKGNCCTHISLQTESPAGEHVTSTPPLPLRILSGLRTLRTREQQQIVPQSTHSSGGRLYSPSGLPWHQAKQGWKALRTNSAQPNVAGPPLEEKSGLQSSFIHRQSRTRK